MSKIFRRWLVGSLALCTLCMSMGGCCVFDGDQPDIPSVQSGAVESSLPYETQPVPPGVVPETTTQDVHFPDWDARYPEGNQYVLTDDHLLEVGSGKNIMVFLIDRFDTRYVELIEQSRPEYFEQFADFTYYADNVSAYSRTYPSVATMLTGIPNDFDAETNASEYFESAYQQSGLLGPLKEAGYAINIYTAEYYGYRNARSLRGLADNIALIDESEDNAYDAQDAEVYHLLEEQGLVLGENENTFTFLHLQGMHTPYRIDENGDYPKESSALGAALGCMNMVLLYIEHLKALGLYENATIIITGDHPDPISDYDEPNKPRLTALFVKRAGDFHPYDMSDAPVSQDDFIPSILESAFSGDYGTSYWEVSEDAERLRYYRFIVNSHPSGDETMTIYEIQGDGREFSNWERLYNVSLNGWYYR